ncbi:unnamed protein product [Nezara viridula]|uniref:Uncharacterized protein n=1 Tax=Nezara viridula TaxID=85310 RepID=A0A9P0E3R9_NEZVI|nr:unnamed protein product [Nezara viridula]
MEREVSYPKVTKAPPDSTFYVSTKYESLDYDHLDSEVYIEEEEIRGKKFMLSIVIKRVFIFSLIGIFVGTLGAIIEIGIYYGSFMRYSLLYNATHAYMDEKFLKLCYLWTMSILAPAFIASVLVAYGEPMAMGGGAHLALSYLNGINIRDIMKYKFLLIKTISLILTVMSGLPTGKLTKPPPETYVAKSETQTPTQSPTLPQYTSRFGRRTRPN